MEPPVVPRDRLDGWQRVDEATERAFAAGPVSVDASTVRYERTATEPPRPFCFASRLRIRPMTAPNSALTALVERRARSGFRDRLAERGIEDVEHRGDRGIAIDDPAASRATLSTFRGIARVGTGGRRVPVEALIAVWTAGEYLLGGGAYPLGETGRALGGGAYPLGETGRALGGESDSPGEGPADARRELRGIVRGIEPPAACDGTD
ncbi:hypothetical protein [Halorubrum amylolyticum]|uniref:hypothetical protein n=1 Tax=Halorubrum amylolyticum TaxID=2508724 RepID=UPI001008CE32|nr:hypothetical protein [Halorubrum amylolyticum]